MPLPLGPVYPITAMPNRHGWTHADLAGRFIEAGIRLFQIRDKEMAARPLLRQIGESVRLGAQAGALLLVNDRIDLALASGAGGVHLGQEDIPPEAARRIAGRDFVIGVSTHNRSQFDFAQQLDVDYVALGPVFSTSTKPGENQPLGIDAVAEIVSRKRRPVVAIGGITLETAPLLWAAGVDSVAVISDIVGAEHPSEQILRYLEAARK